MDKVHTKKLEQQLQHNVQKSIVPWHWMRLNDLSRQGIQAKTVMKTDPEVTWKMIACLVKQNHLFTGDHIRLIDQPLRWYFQHFKM